MVTTHTLHLMSLRPVVRSLATDAAKMMIQAFVSLRLDYCNSLFYRISDRLIRRLQAVQNAAARLVTGTRRRDHISPVLRQLHWLPVHQRTKFKLAVLVYKSLYSLAPQYLVEDCELCYTNALTYLLIPIKPSSSLKSYSSILQTCFTSSLEPISYNTQNSSSELLIPLSATFI